MLAQHHLYIFLLLRRFSVLVPQKLMDGMLLHVEQPSQLMAQNLPRELKLNSLLTQLRLRQVHLEKMALQIHPHVPLQLAYLSEKYKYMELN